MIGSGGVRVVFGVCAVRDDEYLHIFVQPAACPETVALVSVSGFHSTPSGQYCCINLSNLLMFSFCQVLRFPLKSLPLCQRFFYMNG